MGGGSQIQSFAHLPKRKQGTPADLQGLPPPPIPFDVSKGGPTNCGFPFGFRFNPQNTTHQLSLGIGKCTAATARCSSFPALSGCSASGCRAPNTPRRCLASDLTNVWLRGCMQCMTLFFTGESGEVLHVPNEQSTTYTFDQSSGRFFLGGYCPLCKSCLRSWVSSSIPRVSKSLEQLGCQPLISGAKTHF